jgi:hypothetical protein
MTVYVNNITINTGEYFSRDFYLDNIDGTPLNLVGYAASSYIRKHPESLTPTAKFNLSFVDRDNGRIRVSLASTVTATIKPGRYVYDVLFVDNTTKKSIVIEGNILATDDISTSCTFLKLNYDNTYGAIETDGQKVNVGSSYPSTTITATDIDNIGDYGIVVFGYFDRCGTLPELVSNLSDSSYLDKINQYLNRGGVVWFRGENGPNCANQTTSNQALALLGSSIRVNNVFYDSSPATRVTSNTLFPATIGHDRTNSLNLSSGGTALYNLTDFGITVAYERVGNGIIFVNADVNSDWQSPSSTLYTAIRDLVLNG